MIIISQIHFKNKCMFLTKQHPGKRIPVLLLGSWGHAKNSTCSCLWRPLHLILASASSPASRIQQNREGIQGSQGERAGIFRSRHQAETSQSLPFSNMHLEGGLLRERSYFAFMRCTASILTGSPQSCESVQMPASCCSCPHAAFLKVCMFESCKTLCDNGVPLSCCSGKCFTLIPPAC